MKIVRQLSLKTIWEVVEEKKKGGGRGFICVLNISRMGYWCSTQFLQTNGSCLLLFPERERERALITKQKPREDSPISSSPVCSETQHRHFIILLLSISGIHFDLKVSIIAGYSGVLLLMHCCC